MQVVNAKIWGVAFPHDLEGKPKKPRDDRVNAVSTLLRGSFSTAPEGIGRSEQLALELAKRGRFLRDYLDQELRRQEKDHREGELYRLYEVFREQVFHELTLAEFADAVAQMVAYGLFLAKLNSGGAEVTLANAKQGRRRGSFSRLPPSPPTGRTPTRCAPGSRSCWLKRARRRPFPGSPRNSPSTLWLPEDEALQFGLAFEAEFERLAPSA